MLGAIIGDIVGSIYEFHNIKTKEFDLFNKNCSFTDDTVMTVAVADSLLSQNENESIYDIFIKKMKEWGNRYIDVGYGTMFLDWLKSDNPQPYNSYGNGSAMRVSPCGMYALTMFDALDFAKQSAEVTHNHPDGINGAQATAAAIFLARQGKSKQEIWEYVDKNFYTLDKTLDEIRPDYKFFVSCKNTVPPAIIAFLESNSFEDAIRNAISIGGDSDTIAAITGGIAEAFYGVPDDLAEMAKSYLPNDMGCVINDFYNKTKE